MVLARPSPLQKLFPIAGAYSVVIRHRSVDWARRGDGFVGVAGAWIHTIMMASDRTTAEVETLRRVAARAAEKAERRADIV